LINFGQKIEEKSRKNPGQCLKTMNLSDTLGHSLESLEDYMDKRFNQLFGIRQGSSSDNRTSTPAATAATADESMSEEDLMMSPVTGSEAGQLGHVNKHGDSPADVVISSQPQQTQFTEGLGETLSEPLTQFMRDSPAGKKRKRSSLKEGNKLSEEQKLIAETVMDSLLGVFSGYLTRYKDTINSQVQMALEKHEDQAEIIRNRHSTEMELLSRCLATTKDQLTITEGRLTRAEKELEDLREQQLRSEARSMRDNLVFYNVPEEGDQENTETTLRKFMKVEMKISDDDLNNVISFDRVHRIVDKDVKKNKDKKGKWIRPIVAKFTSSKGKETVMRHAKNLRKGMKFGVNDQLPREMDERKKQLMPQYKEAKAGNKRPKWSLDKLVIDKKVIEVERDRVKDIHLDTAEVAASMDIHHTQPMENNGSSFQGHSTKICSQDDVVPALHAIYADNKTARASHNIYAYRIQTGGGSLIEHYEDDRAWGAGRELLKLLRQHNITNRMVCVTRWNGASYLGRTRYDDILKAAKITLQIEL